MGLLLNCTKRILPLAGLLCALSANSFADGISATAGFTAVQLNSTAWEYTITLTNTGTTQIGTFWFAWIPGQGFLSAMPLNINAPANWGDSVTNAGAAIMWTTTASPLAAGDSLSGFTFDSTETPGELLGAATSGPGSGDPVTTSFVYIGAALADPGFQFTVNQAPTSQLTTAASPSGSGTITASPPSQTGSYASGSVVCLTAHPGAGYIFTGWTGTPLNAAGCLTIPFPGSAAASVTANFTVEPSRPPLSFVPAVPCRIVDTRGAVGPLGGPSLAAGTARSFTITSACSIPSTASAYSLNLTVVPKGTLGYVTLWPTGQTQPLASTLNSLDGRVKSNAAIVPAGTGGAVSVFATDSTDVILDINGYFDAASDASALAFYPLTPCRVADTRNATGALGGPSLVGGLGRIFPVETSACDIPVSAMAYSLNFTAVPQGPLGYLTVWPAGQDQPVVSTLNAPTAAVTANAAIVPAGNAGAIELFVTDNTDMVIDINGYFAAPGTGGYYLYNLAPCRIEDSRQPAGNPAFTGTLAVTATGVACGVPPEAQALVLNATVVPSGELGYLTLWANGGSQPIVSTLNSLDGSVTSNMALVPTTNGSVNAYAAGPAPTYLILDVAGYFAASNQPR